MIQTHNRASALIMTVAFISLVISLGAVFLTQTSSKLSESVSEKVVNYAHLACDYGMEHAKNTMLSDHKNHTYTSYKSKYVTDFLPVTTSGTPVGLLDSVDGIYADSDDRVNLKQSDRVTYIMAEAFQNSLRETSNWNSAYGYMYDIRDTSNSSGNSRSSRWYDLYYLDANGDRVATEAAAEFVVRYTVETADEYGKAAINPSYPGHPIPFDFNDPDNLDYLSYQTYLHRYGKALRSMIGAPRLSVGGKQGYMKAAVGSFRPLYAQEKENVNAEADPGHRALDGNKQDLRINYDMLFRGVGLTQYQPRDYKAMTPTIAGKNYSYGQMNASFKTAKSELADNRLPRMFSPFTRGLRDADLAGADDFPDSVSNIPDPNCPWHVNVCTSTLFTIQGMIFGMSTHTQTQYNGKSWYSGKGGGKTLDLFGKNYPEAFPLDIDAGKPVFLIGGDRDGSGKTINGTMHLPRSPRIHKITGQHGRFIFHRAYRNSYWGDVCVALYQACAVGKSIWNFGKAPADSDCRITTTPGDLTADPKVMQAQLEEEFLRILGENVTINYSSAPAPQGTYSYIVNDGLLATANKVGLPDTPPSDPSTYNGSHYSFVGYNQISDLTADLTRSNGTWSNNNADSYDDRDFLLRRRACSLPPHANTRAMEYLINDVRMSVFGSPALDFNRDGVAESTRAGWRDENGNTKWSWWFDGVPLAHSTSGDLKWLEIPTWYRMSLSGGAAQLERWTGVEWEPWTQNINTFFRANKAFLNEDFVTSNSGLPIKPWSATGRLFVGKSHVFSITCRAEVFDLISENRIAQYTAEEFVNIDANKDGEFDDTYVIYRRTYGRTKFVGAQEY